MQTTDFFTPIVDDPYDFGRIAATNAIRDIYAMGGRPIMALNLVGFPLETLGGEVLGADPARRRDDAVRAAGAGIVGGHSIDDPEPKFGLAVTGLVHPDELRSAMPAGATAICSSSPSRSASASSRPRSNAASAMPR